MVDLFRLTPSSEHPHCLSDRDFDTLFTENKPIIFNFHGYPWLIHRLTYRRTNHKNLHVRGYKEKGNINTPLDLAIRNQIDRFTIAMDVIDRVPTLRASGALGPVTQLGTRRRFLLWTSWWGSFGGKDTLRLSRAPNQAAISER